MNGTLSEGTVTGGDLVAESFEDLIDVISGGITRGCNPPNNTQFCPDR